MMSTFELYSASQEFAKNNPGVAMEEQHMAKILQIQYKENMELSGFAPIAVDKPTGATVRSFMEIAGNFKNAMNVDRTKSKNEARKMKESSIRSAVSYAITLSQHFEPSPKELETKGWEDATSGAQDYRKRMLKHFNCDHIRTINRELIFGTDDKACYITFEEQKRSKNQQRKIVFQNPEREIDYSARGVVSDSAENTFMQGQIARMTWTMSPDNSLSPFFVQMLHLSEKEMPVEKFPDGIHVITIKGLSVGGGDARNNHEGYIVFVRRGSDEVKIHALYDEVVFLPLLKLKREQLGQYNNVDILPQYRAVRWTDGGQPQLKAIVSENKMETLVDC